MFGGGPEQYRQPAYAVQRGAINAPAWRLESPGVTGGRYCPHHAARKGLRSTVALPTTFQIVAEREK
jgi:hypothetical protein